jgi:integrase/recombinase XerD
VGKGNKRRWCYFGGHAEAAVRAYLDGHRHHPHPALFTERQARLQGVRRLSYGSAYRDWRAAVGRSPALAVARLHDLRHTFATERAGLVPLEVLRALLGHANIQTTLVYQKVTSDLAREAAHAALEKLAETHRHRR